MKSRPQFAGGFFSFIETMEAIVNVNVHVHVDL